MVLPVEIFDNIIQLRERLTFVDPLRVVFGDEFARNYHRMLTSSQKGFCLSEQMAAHRAARSYAKCRRGDIEIASCRDCSAYEFCPHRQTS